MNNPYRDIGVGRPPKGRGGKKPKQPVDEHEVSVRVLHCMSIMSVSDSGIGGRGSLSGRLKRLCLRQKCSWERLPIWKPGGVERRYRQRGLVRFPRRMISRLSQAFPTVCDCVLSVARCFSRCLSASGRLCNHIPCHPPHHPCPSFIAPYLTLHHSHHIYRHSGIPVSHCSGIRRHCIAFCLSLDNNNQSDANTSFSLLSPPPSSIMHTKELARYNAL